ncbi:MAG: PAS domain S-box protein, partial [Rubrivivax sp.]
MSGLCVALLVAFVGVESRELQADSRARLQANLDVLATVLAVYAQHEDGAAAQRFLGAFAQRKGVDRIDWTDARGSIVAFKGAPNAAAVPAWFASLAAYPAPQGSRGIELAASRGGEVTLHMRNHVADLWNMVCRAAELLLIGVSALMLATFFIVWHGLRPLALLAAGVKRFGNGEFRVRVAPTGPKEIESSIHAFNAMAQHVGAVVDSLRDSEARNARLAEIVEQSSESILTCDTAGIVTSWNPGSQRLFGWSESEALGKSVRDLLLRGMSDATHAAFLQQLRSAEASNRDGWRLARSGSVLQVT